VTSENQVPLMHRSISYRHCLVKKKYCSVFPYFMWNF